MTSAVARCAIQSLEAIAGPDNDTVDHSSTFAPMMTVSVMLHGEHDLAGEAQPQPIPLCRSSSR